MPAVQHPSRRPDVMGELEVIIVGGGPAGLTTALFLVAEEPSLAGRIVVLEKAVYPRDKICGGAIAARAEDLLATIGVHVDVPGVPMRGFSMKSRHGQLCQRMDYAGRVVRRFEFDHGLARVAMSRGIRIDQGVQVTGIHVSRESVLVDTSSGPYTAQAVVGADGVGSVVRRSLGLGAGNLRAQVIEVDTEPVVSDLERDILHFDAADDKFAGYSWDFPTMVEGREMVCRGVYHLKIDGHGNDVQERLARHLEHRGLDMSKYPIKRFAERGFEPNVSASAPRALLVGEALGIDSITGEGIAQAIQYGATAGKYLAECSRSRNYQFADWTKYLRRQKVGIDLRIRHWLLPYYYGKHRHWFERYFASRPEFLASSLGEFAGRPVSNWLVARGTVAALWHIARAQLRWPRRRTQLPPAS